MKLDDALDVFFVAVDEAFGTDRKPEHGRALHAAMERLANVGAGMPGHSVCTGGSCGCRLKFAGFDPKKMPPSTTHVRRRECHS